jgi:hypothetical protein
MLLVRDSVAAAEHAQSIGLVDTTQVELVRRAVSEP